MSRTDHGMVCHATVSGAVCDGPRRVAQTMACQLRGSRRLPKLRLSPQSPHSGFRPPIPVPPRSCPLPAPVSSGPRLPPSPAAGSHACRQCPPSGPTRPLVLVPWVTVPTRPLVLVHWCFGNKLPPSGPTRPLVLVHWCFGNELPPSGPTLPLVLVHWCFVHWCFGNKLPPSGPTRPLVRRVRHDLVPWVTGPPRGPRTPATWHVRLGLAPVAHTPVLLPSADARRLPSARSSPHTR